MGKNKQAQRTKNNARPSNSGRSAQLLGASVPNYVGFSAVKDGGYVPVLPGLAISAFDEIATNKLEPNFQLVLKKMNKKDSTTKLKALQEFSELCRDSKLEIIEAVLPFWPKLYCLLAVDVEHRVREAAHLAHMSVVKRVGRNIAPYLKQLAGPWFTSQYDTYPPAASAATNAFHETFPPKKLVDAIIHCQEEILAYICDNVTVQKPQSLSTHKTVTPEEMEARYQRVLISSLQGYSLYFKKIPSEQIERMATIHQKIVSSNKFWKLAKHEAPLVRAAFFGLLASMIEHSELLFKDEKKRTLTTIMNSLDETEPGVLPAVWEAVLLAISKMEDWHTIVSVEKLVLPKLWRMLRDGGQGSANVIYPNLLPLISHFPNLNVDKDNLYANFFDNMRQGFKVKSVQLSRSEMLAVATSFTECLRYAVLLNSENQVLCGKLLEEQLLPTIKWCIGESSMLKPILLNQITRLVRYWSKNRYLTEYRSYSYLVQRFWAELETLFHNQIQPNDENTQTANVHNSQLDLLLSLKNITVFNRKNLKVKFCEPDEHAVTQSQTKSKETDDDVVFVKEHNQFVNKVCTAYFANIDADSSGKMIEFLSTLISNFQSEELFMALAKAYKTDATLFDFYEGKIKCWLTEKPEQFEAVVQVIFGLIRFLDESDKAAVLTSLTEIDNISVMRYAVWCALSESNRNDPAVKHWCSQSNVENLLIDMARQVATNKTSKDTEMNKNILISCFKSSEAGDLIVSENAFKEMSSIFCETLNDPDLIDLNSFAEFLSHLSSLTWTHKCLMSGTIQMLETLFELSCRDYQDEFILSSENTVRSTWKKGLCEISKKLSCSSFIDLSRRFAAIIWEKIFDSKNSQFKNRLVDVAKDFVEAVVNNNCDAGSDFVKEITVAFLTESNIASWLADVTTIILYGEVVTGNLYVRSASQRVRIGRDSLTLELEKDSLKDNTVYCLEWALFNVKLLNKLVAKKPEDQDDDEVVTFEAEYNEPIESNLPAMEETLTNILYIGTLGHLYIRHYKSTKYYDDVRVLLTALKKEFNGLLTLIDEDTHEKVRSVLEESLNDGGIWPHVQHFYYTELGISSDLEACLPINNRAIRLTADTHPSLETDVQVVQVLCKYVTRENIPLNLAEHINELLIARSMIDVFPDNVYDINNAIERIVKRYQVDSSFMLLDCDISGVSWEQLTLPLEVIRLLTTVVTTMPTQIPSAHWDFILISLASLQLTVNKSKRSCESLKVTALTVAVSQLFHAVQHLLYKHELEPIENLPSTLLDEWKNVFAEDIYMGIIQTWILYSDLYNQHSISPMQVLPLNYLGETMKLVDGTSFFKKQKSISGGPVNLDQVVRLSLKLIQSPVPSLQLAAYHVLKQAVKQHVEDDKAIIETENFDPNSLSLIILKDVLSSTQNVVNTMLMDFKLCETVNCTIQPYTDSYTYTLGYLLVWAIMLDMCAEANAELRYQYAELLKNDFFTCLLNNLFRLMPVEVLQDNKNKVPKLTEIFSTAPSLSFTESWTEWRLDHIVCWLYANSLRHLPVLVRQWWGTADTRVSLAVDRITTLYVSPILCQEELLNNKLTDIENMQVKVHPTAREVIALYQVEDAKLELSIVLPVNHPLGPVTVEPGQHAGGAANWRNCHMQLSIFLTHQNGSIWDGLTLWKRNLDKRFSGVEECYICFSILHASTYQIPKLSCHTCRKKFHTPCLYKWFSTSQKSTCPICRNVF